MVIGTEGKLLRHPEAESQGLAATLAACRDPDPSRRPNAATLADQLREIRDRLQVDSRRQTFWATIQEVAAPDRDRAWFGEVLSKFRRNMENFCLGMYGDEFERAAEIADFLNQSLEAYPVRHGRDRLTLGSVKHQDEETGKDLATPSMEFLHKARTWLNHGPRRPDERRRVLQRLGNPSEDEIRSHVADGTARIGEFLSLESLSALIETLYDA